MAVARCFPGVPDLAGVAGAALGSRPGLVAVKRLRGGSKKGVYRLTFRDQSTVVAYLWAPAENFWPTHADGPTPGESAGLSGFA